MADSSAYIPGISPGARIQDGAGTFSRTSRCVVRIAGVRVHDAGCRRRSARRTRCGSRSARRRRARRRSACPSASAPSSKPLDRRRPVAGQRRTSAAGSARTLTGRPAARAASAARITCGRVVPLDPNPPPTCGDDDPHPLRRAGRAPARSCPGRRTGPGSSRRSVSAAAGIPGGERGVRLHRVVVLHRRRVGRVHAHCRGGQRRRPRHRTRSPPGSSG